MILELMSDTFSCPNCGADVPPNASACPECGSDEGTGWAENADSYGVLPAEYEPAYVERDGIVDGNSRPRRGWIRYTAAILLMGMTLPAFLFLSNPIFSAATTVLAIALALALVIPQLRSTGALKARGRDRASDNGDLYETLVGRTRGDRARANRLIEYERSRNPSASRTELIRDAIDRLERDR